MVQGEKTRDTQRLKTWNRTRFLQLSPVPLCEFTLHAPELLFRQKFLI